MRGMDEHEWLAERFEEHRPHLRAVAYRMLGSLSEADDAVQEAWLRLSRADTSGVENLGGWLTTVVARVCLDMLRSRKSRREEPLGRARARPDRERADGTDPEHEALLADSVGLALLVVLETLGSRRAARVRAARHVRRALRRDRAHRRALPDRGPAARQPRPPPGAGRRPGSRRRSRAPARGRRRLPRRRARAATSPRCSRCSIPTSCSRADRGDAARRPALGPRSAMPWPARPSPSPGTLHSCAPRWSTEPPESWSLLVGGRRRSSASRSRAERSSRSTRSPTPSASPPRPDRPGRLETPATARTAGQTTRKERGSNGISTAHPRRARRSAISRSAFRGTKRCSTLNRSSTRTPIRTCTTPSICSATARCSDCTSTSRPHRPGSSASSDVGLDHVAFGCSDRAELEKLGTPARRARRRPRRDQGCGVRFGRELPGSGRHRARVLRTTRLRRAGIPYDSPVSVAGVADRLIRRSMYAEKCPS